VVLPAMFGAIDCARSPVEAVIEPGAICMCEAAMACRAHESFLVPDGGFAAFKVSRLARVEASTVDALRDALLLVFAALVDRGGMALHRSRSRCGRCLSKANG